MGLAVGLAVGFAGVLAAGFSVGSVLSVLSGSERRGKAGHRKEDEREYAERHRTRIRRTMNIELCLF